MAVSVDILRETLRADLDDPLLPGENDDDIPPDQDCLWSDDDLERYIKRTQKHLARRLYLIRDRVDITLVADQAEYTVPEYYLRSYTAFVNDTTKRPLEVMNLNELEEGAASWHDYGLQQVNTWRTSTGAPRILLFEERFYKVTVAPTPSADDAGTVVRIMCARLPRSSELGDDLEITQDLYEDAYLLWAKKLAYEKDDVDSKGEGLAAKFELQFEAEIVRLRGETHQRTRKAGVVRYGGL